MQAEILNIEYHYERLTLAALNKYRNMVDAANALGITERCLYNWMRRFFIRRDVDGSYYQLPNKIRREQITRIANRAINPMPL